MAKDAGGHGSESRGGAAARNPHDGGPIVPGYTSPGAMRLQAVMRANNNPPIVEVPAHSSGVAQIGTEGAASRELRLYADNSADLHRQSMQPIRENLGKKMDK